MAASLFSLSLLSLTILLSSFVLPACSTSRRALQHLNLQNGFRASLKHVDSGKNLTKFELIQRGIHRSLHRLDRLNALVAVEAESGIDIETSVMSGNGEYLMRLAIGTPPLKFDAIMDTGSDLVWTQCKPCWNCFHQPTPIFDPSQSPSFSKVSCSSKLCQALPASSCNDACQYVYEYGDYSETVGYLAYETFTFDDGAAVPKIGFGCGNDNEGEGFGQGAAGLEGLGRGPLSLVSQMTEPKFSYCLTSIDDNKPSTLLMGSLATVNASYNEMKTTRLIKNPAQPSFYYLYLTGVSVAGKPVEFYQSAFEIKDGSGGIIIDSGTTLTLLDYNTYGAIRNAIEAEMTLPVNYSGGSMGLDLCYDLPSGTTSNAVEVPKLVFHFENADLELPVENYMVLDSGLLCFAMVGVSGMSVFGNIQQQNMLITYDLEKETISFLPAKCDERF